MKKMILIVIAAAAATPLPSAHSQVLPTTITLRGKSHLSPRRCLP